MAEFVIDEKGNKHKILSKNVDYAKSMYADIFDDLVAVIKCFFSSNISKKLYDVSKELHNEVGHLKCDENLDFFVVETGYNDEVIKS